MRAIHNRRFWPPKLAFVNANAYFGMLLQTTQVSVCFSKIRRAVFTSLLVRCSLRLWLQLIGLVMAAGVPWSYSHDLNDNQDSESSSKLRFQFDYPAFFRITVFDFGELALIQFWLAVGCVCFLLVSFCGLNILLGVRDDLTMNKWV